MITTVHIHPAPDDVPEGCVLDDATAALYLAGHRVVLLGNADDMELAAYLRALASEAVLLAAEIGYRATREAS